MLILCLLQIKNAVNAALALASKDKALVLYSDLKIVLELGKEFNSDFKGPSQVGSLSSYC